MFLKYNFLTITWSLIIIILCCIPGKEFPDASLFKIPHLDKIVHFTFYFVLSVVSVNYFSKQYSSQLSSSSAYFITFIYGLILGVAIEFIQHFFIPFRDGNALDGLANTTGSIFGLFIVKVKLLPNYFRLIK